MMVDTTVQEKAITFPTDAKLMNRAREKLVRKQHGLKLRQGYPKVGTLALIEYQRYAHAKQFKRARRELRRLRTFLGRVMRDIERQVQGGLRSTTSSDACFPRRPRACPGARPARKVYWLHAPEVECIGKGKAHKPYEFGVKVSVAPRSPFAAASSCWPRRRCRANPYDGHA